MSKILVIDDERSVRNSLLDILEFERYKVELAENGRQGLEMAQNGNFDLIISDIKMPEMEGLELLDQLVANGVDTPVVMISGHGDIATAVQCIKKGAYEYIEKPIDLNKLLTVAKNAMEKKSLVAENKTLKKKVETKNLMVGESPEIQHVRDMIARVAPTDARVMITGSNGTGKEVVARMIHAQSKRAQNALVEVNCAAIPSELIESELFGHEKGSFTSAIKQRIGKFEQADGGTLFLDEIGDMSLAAQTKVLRALQENEITRVGSDKTIKVDVRVLAATNKDLAKEIEKGNFREDLFHRLNVIPIHVPDLDERKADIPLLVDYFNQQVCEEQGIPVKQFEPEAVEALQQRSWRGNIRELRNVVERLIILGGKSITASDVQTYGV